MLARERCLDVEAVEKGGHIAVGEIPSVSVMIHFWGKISMH